MNELICKHLELIQGVINRMASNSFMLKGWTITLVSGIFLITSINDHSFLLFLTALPAIAFWGLDSFYLRQEKLYICLYNHTRKAFSEEKKERLLFSMNVSSYNNEVDSWWRILFSKTELWFYGVLIVVIILFSLYCSLARK